MTYKEKPVGFKKDSKSLPPTSLNTFEAIGVLSILNDGSVQQRFTEQLHSPSDIPPTQSQIDIVRFTWEHVTDTRLSSDKPEVLPAHAFGLAFYSALFDINPDLKTLFPNIMQQALALGGLISYLVRSPKIMNSNSSNGSMSYSQAPSSEQPSTIRQINAIKRRNSTTSSFSELISEVAANKNSNDTTGSTSHLDISHLVCKLHELGARHYSYGAHADHFSAMGHAILKALQTRLGRDYLPEVVEAWTRVYSFTAYHMKAGLQSQLSREEETRSIFFSSSNVNVNTKAQCLLQ